jgi:shikimate dehydrogenase
MPARLEPAAEPTMYFIGVTTGSSSIMRVFPAWAEHLGLDARITGIDLPLHADPEDYRNVVRFIREDRQSLGALVTTHKLDLLKAARDLFDELGDDAVLLEEISSISKSDGRLVGHAKDPITSGLSLEAIVPDGYWAGNDAELLILGAGGSSLALTLYLHRRRARGLDVPTRLVVTNRSPGRLEEMRAVHDRLGFGIPTEYVHAPEPSDNDRPLASLPDGSLVINATGLGKDRPGSPLTDDARFPRGGVAWDFNYRGDLLFLAQAECQREASSLRIVDGWEYFIHGWTRVIAEVFAIDIPTAGPEFDRLSQIARSTTSGAPT